MLSAGKYGTAFLLAGIKQITRSIAWPGMENKLPINNDPRAVRSRQALHEALLRLLEAKPLDQITIRDITAEAGVGYTTFFRHHPTKESLLNEVAADQIGCLISLSMPVMEAHDARAGSAALFSFVKAHRPMWSTLLTGGAAGTIRDEFLRQAGEIAKARAPAGNPLRAEAGVHLLVSGTIELICWWLRQPDLLPIDQISEIHDELVVSPIIAAVAKAAAVGKTVVAAKPAATVKAASTRSASADRRKKSK